MAARRRTPNVAAWHQTGCAKPEGAVSGADLFVGWCASPPVWSAGAYFHQSTMACCRVEANMVARLLTWGERQTQVEGAPPWPPPVRRCPSRDPVLQEQGSGRARADGSWDWEQAGGVRAYAMWGEGEPRRAGRLSLAAFHRSAAGPSPCACGSACCGTGPADGRSPPPGLQRERRSNLRKCYRRDLRKVERQAMILHRLRDS